MSVRRKLVGLSAVLLIAVMVMAALMAQSPAQMLVYAGLGLLAGIVALTAIVAIAFHRAATLLARRKPDPGSDEALHALYAAPSYQGNRPVA